ncbi:MAG: hypothetical protein HC837_02530 [Chloroflexaceae bacterium]|nr:hypothetical protein [Chloroflexaceae bacterium]
MGNTHTLTVTLFGMPSVLLGNQSLKDHIHTKAQALLYYLITTQRTYYRDELASLFWPDMPDSQARKNLRNILPVLRTYLESHIEVTRNTVTFNRYTSYWLDVEAFQALVGIDPARVSTEALWQAMDLYPDDFLTGFYVRNAPLFEDWMLLMRRNLHDMASDVLDTLARRHLEQGDYKVALQATRRLLEMEPWRESAHRQQMLALAGMGQRSAAISQYEVCHRILLEEFQLEPEDETKSLYEQIQSPNGTIFHTTMDSQAMLGHQPHANGKPAEEPRYASKPFQSVLSPDGQYVAVTTEEATIHVECLIPGQPSQVFRGHTADITALIFSPDGSMLVSASIDCTVRVWNMASSSVRSILQGHEEVVTLLAFHPDGTLLATAGREQAVHLWHPNDGRLLNTFSGPSAPLTYMSFVPSGTALVGTSLDLWMWIWEIDTGQVWSKRLWRA